MTIRTHIVFMPRCLELFAGEGGATRGLQRAGMHVTAIDCDQNAISRNPADVAICADVFEWLSENEATLPTYDFVWASPPCLAHRMLGKDGQDKVPKAHQHSETTS